MTANRPTGMGFTSHDVADGLRRLAAAVERGALHGRTYPQLAVEVSVQLADPGEVVYRAERFAVPASRALDRAGNLHTWAEVGFGAAVDHPVRSPWARFPVVLRLTHIGPDDRAGLDGAES